MMRNASKVEEEEDATWKKKEKKAACKIQVTKFFSLLSWNCSFHNGFWRYVYSHTKI